MEINDIHLNWENVQDKIVGVGILPIYIDANDHISVLLGKERFVSNWRSSLKWSGFEGGRISSESVETGAAREFFEESLGVIRIDPNEDPTIESITNFLCQGRYFARILLCMAPNENSQEYRYHVTYIIQIPKQPHVVQAFLQKRADAVNLQKQINAMNVMQTQLEKTAILPFVNNVYDGHSVVDIHGVKHETTMTHIEYSDSSHMYTASVNNATQYISQYQKWFEQRQRILDICPHVFVQHSTDDNIQFRDEYIEKSTIKYWTFNELEHVIQNHGNSNSEFFRAFFLPTLQRALLELKPYHNQHNNQIRHLTDERTSTTCVDCAEEL